MDQRPVTHADVCTPVDVFEFRKPNSIGRDIRDGHRRQWLVGHGYAMNWVTSRKPDVHLCVVARIGNPRSGRVLTLDSSRLGPPFYLELSQTRPGPCPVVSGYGAA